MSFTTFLQQRLKSQKVLLLGYGREGQSSYKKLHAFMRPGQLGIADKQVLGILARPIPGTGIHTGEGYLEKLQEYDIVFRSPGIPFQELSLIKGDIEVTSQSALFLEYFHHQVIGITGTKGKSTTSTLIRDMLLESGCTAYLAGNIGLPPFELADAMKPGNWAVLELSAHQLMEVRRGPGIGCLLNLYEEHLDHFIEPMAYFSSKWKLFSMQETGDYGIFPLESTAAKELMEILPPRSHMLAFANAKGERNAIWVEEGRLCLRLPGHTYQIDIPNRPGLPGDHNLLNCLVAAAATLLAGGHADGISKAVAEYQGLPHRLQYLGQFGDIAYYNDAIATAPEATMAAIETLGRVDSLILGGMDRGISYEELVSYLQMKAIPIIALSGPAGHRIYDLLNSKGFQNQAAHFPTFREALEYAVKHTPAGGKVLLSPSAPSYDEFSDFTEKGKFFEQMIKGY